MEFLVILIVWALATNIELPVGLQRDDWLIAWRLRASEALRALPEVPRLLLICGLPCLLVAALEWLLGAHWAGIPLFALELAVLLYSIGRSDFRIRLHAYFGAWQRGDYEAAYQEAAQALDLDPAATITDMAELHAQVRRGILYLAFERWFAVVFWFYFLGPWAALFYRILQLTLAQHSTDGDRRLVRQWLLWIEWLPVRMLGLAFAVTGNFARCLSVWRHHLAGFTPVPTLLVLYSEQAVDVAAERNESVPFAARATAELHELDALLARSTIAWLVMFALLQMLR
jgi:AmpE protein